MRAGIPLITVCETHPTSGCPMGSRASVSLLHWSLLSDYSELPHLDISLALAIDARLTECFLGRLRNLEVPEAFHHPQLLVWFPSLASRWDAVAATCQNCVELNGVNELKLKFCLKVSSPWEILKNGMSGCLIFTTETDFFFSICLCRSSKGDIHSEGYILEVECCSSLNQLSDKKEIPDFIKKVSKEKKARGERRKRGNPQNRVSFYLHCYYCC